MFIDEADSLIDALFLALLGQLRAGFEARPKGFPQSIALIGLRDVRDYKIRLRPERESLGTNSPFNVKSESLFLEGFTFAEVESLLDQHTAETGQDFSAEVKDALLTAFQKFYRRHSEAWLARYNFREVGRQLLR